MEIVLNRGNEEKQSIEEDLIKELMDLRGYLDERIQKLEIEVDKLKALFKIVDEVILTRSFKKAEAIPVTEPEKPSQLKEEIPLKTSIGILLATVYVGDEEARIVTAEGLNFTINTPPFQQFLTSRILDSMRTKDMEASQEGMIMPDQVLSYETITEGDVIKELIIRNYGSRRRLKEIISSSRWTFDKMYEKILTSDNSIQ